MSAFDGSECEKPVADRRSTPSPIQSVAGRCRPNLRRFSALPLFFFACSLNWGWAQPRSPSPGPDREPRFHERRILVQAKAGVSGQRIRSFHVSQNSRTLKTFSELGNLEVLEIGPGKTINSALRDYQRSDLFEFVEPDFVVRLASTFPNDPKFMDGTLWGLHNLGQAGGLADADIDAPEGWAIRHCASNIIVAVIDSGVRYTHQDLAANMWRHPITGVHGTNASAGTDDPNDDNGHGTVMAGIIGAAGNNGIGVVGVTWRVQLMACKYTDRFGLGTLSEAIACIEYARMNGAHIINASWGLEEFSSALSNAVSSAREAGIIFVAAAGNRSPPSDNDVYPFYPASLGLDNVVSVAATTRTDDAYILSNYGATSVHLAAPGVEIHSTHHLADNAYVTRSGTSSAAAHVSGAMALARANSPTESHLQLIQRLMNATDPLPNQAGRSVTEGRLNLARMLSLSLPPASLSASLTSMANQLELRVSGAAGQTYVVEATGDFVSWSPILTNQTGPTGTFTFTHVISTNWPARFFRAVRVGP